MIKKTCCFLFSLVVLSIAAAGQQTIPADADAFFQKAMAQINQKHVSWVKKTAMDVNSKNLDENTVNAQAKTYGQLSGILLILAGLHQYQKCYCLYIHTI